MNDEVTVIRKGISKKNGREWYAIVELRPQFQFVPKAVYDAIVASGNYVDYDSLNESNNFKH